jgi:hypothetical protein
MSEMSNTPHTMPTRRRSSKPGTGKDYTHPNISAYKQSYADLERMAWGRKREQCCEASHVPKARTQEVVVLVDEEEEVPVTNLVTLKIDSWKRRNPPPQSHHPQAPIDHAVLRLEPSLPELDEDDEHEVRAIFDLIRQNRAKGRNTKGLDDQLTNLAPVKQRIAKGHERLTRDLALVSQRKHLFDDPDLARDNENVGGEAALSAMRIF